MPRPDGSTAERRVANRTRTPDGRAWPTEIASAAAAMFLLSAPALAQQDIGPAPSGLPARAAPAAVAFSAQPARALIKEDLEAWLDGYLPSALERGNVAGAIVVVVKDGRVLLQKGYGYADVATRRAFDPDTTLFRPGSVSKLVTWTAVMQQVELGRIDLDRDVNAYLDFSIPPRAGRPVTMRNLMTHTGGFEQSFKDVLLTDPAKVVPLGQFLQRHIPARIYAAGEIPAYSNFGAALAGYIVQRVSGQPFEDYVERQIFAPLGIRNASFRQPLPAAIRSQLANGYQLASDPPEPYEIFPAPAGNAVFTGADMARFMIAHLQDGEYEGHRILRAETARLMHGSPLTIVSPALNRMLLGFYEMNRNGHRVIGHEGDTLIFHSILRLLPDEQVGIFVSLNSIGRDGAGRAIRFGVSDDFIDRYFPRQTPRPAVSPELARAHAALLAGQYDGSETELSSYTSLLSLVTQARISIDAAGRIVASSIVGLNGQPKRYEEISPYVWGEAGGGESRLAAKVVDGKVVMWAADLEAPYQVYLPTPIWRSAVWVVPLLVASLAIILLMALVWPVEALVRRGHGLHLALDDRTTRIYRWSRPLALVAGLVMAGWLTTVAVMMVKFFISSALDPWIITLHILSAAVFPLAAFITAWHAWVTWRTRTGLRSAWAKACSTALAAACLVLLWISVVFHLIGTSLAS